MGVLPVCVLSVDATRQNWIPGTGVQMAVSLHVGSKNQTLVLWKAVSDLIC